MERKKEKQNRKKDEKVILAVKFVKYEQISWLKCQKAARKQWFSWLIFWLPARTNQGISARNFDSARNKQVSSVRDYFCYYYYVIGSRWITKIYFIRFWKKWKMKNFEYWWVLDWLCKTGIRIRLLRRLKRRMKCANAVFDASTGYTFFLPCSMLKWSSEVFVFYFSKLVVLLKEMSFSQRDWWFFAYTRCPFHKIVPKTAENFLAWMNEKSAYNLLYCPVMFGHFSPAPRKKRSGAVRFQ